MDGETPTVPVTVAALKSCTGSRDVSTGKKIHADVASSRDDLNIFVATTLVNMYAKFGNMSEASEVFENMSHRDTASWNAMIMGYAQSGDGEQGLEFYRRMKREGCTLDSGSQCMHQVSSQGERDSGGRKQGKLFKLGT